MPRPHALADIFPLMAADDLAALTDDIKTHGLRQPIFLYGDPPRILDGRNRLAACEIAGVEPRFEEFTGTEDEAVAFVLSANLHRRHLTTAQKAALAVRLLPIEQEAARRRQGTRTDLHPNADGSGNGSEVNGQALDLAGKRVGVGRDSVWKASKVAEDAPDVFEAMTTGVVRTLGEAQKLAALDEDRRSTVIATMKAEGVRLKDADGAEPTPWMYRSTGEVEWWTPSDVLDAARRVLGGSIDLDPASCAEANAAVQAARYFDIKDDGLAKPWVAERVFCNPPYGTVGPRGGESRQGVWVRKLLDEHEAGRVKGAILLVRSHPNGAWFQPLWAYPICFVRRRLEFVPGPGVTGQPVAFSVIVGVGVDVDRFVAVWRQWGHVVVPGDENGVGVSVAGCGG